MLEQLLYHWSPRERRESIQDGGLQPGSPSTDRLWNPPALCFSDSPSLAWALSGMTARGSEHVEWDLWCVWGNCVAVSRVIEHGEQGPKEYRTEASILPASLWWVGSRPQIDPNVR